MHRRPAHGSCRVAWHAYVAAQEQQALPAELHVFEAAGHAMFAGTAPEERERTREIRQFCARHWR